MFEIDLLLDYFIYVDRFRFVTHENFLRMNRLSIIINDASFFNLESIILTIIIIIGRVLKPE